MIHTITLNPSIDQHITVGKLVSGDKITPERMCLEPGGKGFNVARVICELGGKAKAFGFCGGAAGKTLKDLLDRELIAHRLCPIRGEIRTNLIIHDRTKGQSIRINPPGPRVSQSEVNRLLAMLKKVRPRPSFWILSGSLPPGVPNDIYAQLINAFQARGERCVLDTDGEPLSLGLKAKPFMIKPNAFELKRLIGHDCKTKSEIIAAGRRLNQSAQVVAITLGNKGAYVFTQKEIWHCWAPAVKVKSDVGAGDAFIGAFLTALDRGQDFKQASRWAVAAATVSVTNEGTARCDRGKIERMVKNVAVVGV